MKEKQFACVVLGMAIFACFFGIMKMQTKLQEARKEAESAKESAEAASRERVVTSANFADLEKRSQAQIEYYRIWKPHFESFPQGEHVTKEFELKMKEADVNPFTESFEPAAYTDKFGVISKLQRVDLVFVGGYEMLFNFLGTIESSINTARVTSCSVKKAAGDEDIRMELTIDVPIIETADAAGAPTP